jgi:FtsP/CotA-like multicopper oxidase with cupredoxin domain
MASTAPPPPLRVLARPMTAFAFALVLTYGSMLAFGLPAHQAAQHQSHIAFVGHWLHDSTILFPIVLAAVWSALALSRRLLEPAQRIAPLAAAASAAGAALAGAFAFSWGRGVVLPVLAPHAQAHHELAQNWRLVDDAVLALVVGLPLAGIAAAAAVASSPRGRRSLKNATALATAAILAGTVAWQAHANDSDTDRLRDIVTPCFNGSPVAAPFTAQFTVPPHANPVSAPNDPGTDTYQITERRSVAQIIPGINTPIWGYNGIIPGPTIVARKLRPVRVTFTNNLPPNDDPSGIIVRSELDPDDHPFIPSTTSVHLHGINADHISDGYPQDDAHHHQRRPGESLIHFYPNNEYQRPATLWYHDHSVHITSPHLFRGLSAFYILQDDREDQLRLPGSPLVEKPGQQGVADGPEDFDVPLLLKDVMIDPATGLLIWDNCDHHGAYGDVMTINGKQQPRFPVAARKYRFRLVNSSDSRQYLLAIRRVENLGRPSEDSTANEPFTYIGTDQGLLPAPEPVRRFHTVISDRHEFVVDFSRYPVGTRLVLVNLLASPADSKLFPIMAFDVNRVEEDRSQVPPVLRGDESPADRQPPSASRVFKFHRSDGYWEISEHIFDINRDDAKPALNTTEDWTLINDSGGWGHPVHIHLGRFRILKIVGRPPQPGELNGFKDVVWVGPNQTITVRHQFFNFTGRFVFHCHNLSHEDSDMMSQFNVQPSP